MNHKRGFTIVELMIAIVFVSFLLMAIALLIIQISNTYNKGVTLKAVNQAGTSVSRDMQIRLNEVTGSVIFVENVLGGNNEPGVGGGRLCTGRVSYIWNYPKSLATNNVSLQANRYNSGTTMSDTDIRMVKIADYTQKYCRAETVNNNQQYPLIPRQNATELLAGNDRNLAVHQLMHRSYAVEGGQVMQAVTMVLGTNNPGEFLGAGDVGYIATQAQCKPPTEGYNAWCAVNTFDFIARSSSNGGEE